ncbi:hypothetical protein FCV43_19480 [Vibrio genomosp. F6]|uniref:Uncharacterized protein n=1 Tax=Vibrio genomosp. F6 TaxID=723172 RepID=A0A0H3ZWN6_9VIBR|nr:hypothetical protein [Vibrio genomosp. F6]AKN38992.1 hypothetical protein [Vibrio genomosp. F6]TKF14628.1 hypothetical protein FCV43_19480 [Vibrio genomosp. F6]
MVNPINKKTKQKTKNQHKQLLAKKISELGIDGVLYPNAIQGRHPYTQEIMIMAMSQNVKQDELSQICKVSQSQISQWANGAGFAKVDQLSSLLPKLKSTAPGSSFHKFNVVKKSIIELPEDWEQECFIAYLKEAVEDKVSELDLENICEPVFKELIAKKPGDWFRGDCMYGWKITDFNAELLEEAVYGTLKQEHCNQVDKMTKLHKHQLDTVTSEVDELQSSKQNAEQEAQDNQTKIDIHTASIQKFYNERPELIEVSDDIKKTLALREYPEPDVTHESNQAYEVLLQALAEKMNVNIDYSIVIGRLNHKIEELKIKHDTEMSNLKISQTEEQNKKTIFGKFNLDYAVSSIKISDFFLLPLSVIQSKADELYDSKTIDLVVPLTAVISNTYQRTRHEIAVGTLVKLNLKEAFVDFCRRLPLQYEQEIVQISGHCIFTFGDIECYRLHSDRLLTKHRRQSEHEFIHVDCDGNGAIDTVRKLNDIYDIGSELEEKLANTLIEQGYLLSDVRTIY